MQVLRGDPAHEDGKSLFTQFIEPSVQDRERAGNLLQCLRVP